MNDIEKEGKAKQASLTLLTKGGGSDGKVAAYNSGDVRYRFNPRVGKIL